MEDKNQELIIQQSQQDISQNFERKERLKLIGNPIQKKSVEQPTSGHHYLLLEPFGEGEQQKQEMPPNVGGGVELQTADDTETTTIVLDSFSSNSHITNTNEEQIMVCAWLTCSECGYQTFEPLDLDEHFLRHSNVTSNNSWPGGVLNSIKFQATNKNKPYINPNLRKVEQQVEEQRKRQKMLAAECLANVIPLEIKPEMDAAKTRRTLNEQKVQQQQEICINKDSVAVSAEGYLELVKLQNCEKNLHKIGISENNYEQKDQLYKSKPQQEEHLSQALVIPATGKTAADIPTNIHKRNQCKWCNNKFPTMKKLEEHARIHTGERPFVCKTCGYGTRNASALSYHLKTHKEDRPYKCSLCNYRNTTVSSLRSHLTRVHLFPSNGNDFSSRPFNNLGRFY